MRDANRLKTLSVVIGATLVLSGCLDTGPSASSSSGSERTDTAGAGGGSSDVRVAFDPQEQILPFPNNLLFEADAQSEEDLDGTLNVPIEDPDDSSAAVVEGLNALNGFSTVGDWRVAFTGDIDDGSLIEGTSVRVFKMDAESDTYPGRIRPDSVVRELEPEDEFVVQYQPDNRVLKIVPTQPLQHDTNYTAVLTRDVLDTDGLSVGSPIPWSIARGDNMLDQCDDPGRPETALLQCMTNFAIAPIESDERFNLTRDDMIMAWGVTTQREDRTFTASADFYHQALAEMAQGNDDFRMMEFLDVSSSGDDAPETPGGQATVWPGTVTLPYGLAVPEVNLDGAPTRDDAFLGSQWTCDDGGCNTDANFGLLDDDAGVAIPQVKNAETVPAVLALPQGDAPAGGFPVVIFQHAIQQDRSTALAIADELAAEGFAVVAIDMPFHGIVLNQLDVDGNETDAARADLHATAINEAMNAVEQGIEGFLSSNERLVPHYERTFYANLTDDGGTEGLPDPSGTHFLVPDTPLAQRDIMRQASLDLVNMAHYLRAGYFEQVCVEADLSPIDFILNPIIAAIAGLGCDNDSLHDLLNTDEIHFVGHSVGNIVAAPFLAYDQQVRSATFMAPTGGIMRTLENSETIGPQLEEGLADAGVVPGTEDFYRFIVSVQAAIDPVEPHNHAEAMATRVNADGETEDRPIFISQIVGNEGAQPSPGDLVLPHEVDGAPLAGSTPLARSMGLSLQPRQGDDPSVVTPAIREDGTQPEVLQTAIGFRFGDHASFLLPMDEIDEPVRDIADVDTHDEMQHQVRNFLRNQGQQIEILDTDLIQQR